MVRHGGPAIATPVSSAAVLGAAVHSTSAPPTVSGTSLATGSTISVSGSAERFSLPESFEAGGEPACVARRPASAGRRGVAARKSSARGYVAFSEKPAVPAKSTSPLDLPGFPLLG
jgi:hypothetical protein